MKKLSVLIALALTVAMTGCGGGAAAPAGTADNTAASATDTASTAADTAVADTEKDEAEEVSDTDAAESADTSDTAGETEEAAAEETGEEATETASAGNPLTPFGNDPFPVPEFSAAALPESSALEFTKGLGMGWNLGNTFDAIDAGKSDDLEYESAWVGVKTEEVFFDTLKDAGFKTIRIPVSWHNHVDENYKINEAWLDRVQEVVDWVYNRDMYVIINIHHDNNEDYEYPSYDKLDQTISYVTTIWEQLSERFADYDTHLIFETMNEPRHVNTDHEWWLQSTTSGVGAEACDCINQINQAAVDTIRENGQGYNTERYIMVPGYCASPDFEAIEAFILPEDSKGTAENRILVSSHAYTPYSFALDASGTDEFSIADQKGTYDIDAVMKKLYNKFTSQGIGVVMGEFASVNKDNLQARIEHAAYYTACATNYGIPCVWWDNNLFTGNGERLGIFRRMSNSFLYPEIVDQLIYYAIK